MRKIIQKLHKIQKNTEIQFQYVDKLKHYDDFYKILRSCMLVSGFKSITDSRIDLIVDTGEVFIVSSLDYISLHSYSTRREMAGSCNLHTISSGDILKLTQCNNWLSVNKDLYDFSGQYTVYVPMLEAATSLAAWCMIVFISAICIT